MFSANSANTLVFFVVGGVASFFSIFFIQYLSLSFFFSVVTSKNFVCVSRSRGSGIKKRGGVMVPVLRGGGGGGATTHRCCDV